MKKILSILFSFLAIGCFIQANAQEIQQSNRTSIKSGIIKYKNIRIMQGGKKVGEDTNSTLYFDKHGDYEFYEDYTPVSINGKKTLKHVMHKLENSSFYDYDLSSELLKKIPASANGAFASALILTKAEIENMKAKKVGEEKVLGYPCIIWEFGFGRIWTHENIVLKLDVGAMFFQAVQEAIDIKFDVAIDKIKLQKIERGILKTTDSIVNHQSDIDKKKFIDLPIYSNFSRVDANIAKKKRSNLYWQDNKEAKTTIKTFDEANRYCENLTLGDIKDWRVPTYKELISIVNYKREKPSIADEFKNCAKADYWSSTKLATNSKKVWYIYFREARSDFQYVTEPFDYKKHVRCVNDKFANKRAVDINFTREKNTIIDNIHNLQWQDETKTKVDTYNFKLPLNIKTQNPTNLFL